MFEELPWADTGDIIMVGQSDDADEIIDDSHWWKKYQETEYAWELANGIYDPPANL